MRRKATELFAILEERTIIIFAIFSNNRATCLLYKNINFKISKIAINRHFIDCATKAYFIFQGVKTTYETLFKLKTCYQGCKSYFCLL